MEPLGGARPGDWECPECHANVFGPAEPPPAQPASCRVISDCHPSEGGAEPNENLWIIGI
jgi:hypothetical protein